MDGTERFNGFQLDDQTAFYQEIQFQGASHPLPLVIDEDMLLTFETKMIREELHRQALPIDRLE